MNENINIVSEAFCTSSPQLSRRLCQDLDSIGPLGQLVSLLFKAEKASMQAKSYSGREPVSRRPYGDYSNDRMTKMPNEAIQLLDTHAKDMDVSWGWSKSDVPATPPWVLCIDLPTGLVTFSMEWRRLGSDYGLGAEDDSQNSDRITEFCAGVLEGYWMQAEEDIWEQSAPRTLQSGD